MRFIVDIRFDDEVGISPNNVRNIIQRELNNRLRLNKYYFKKKNPKVCVRRIDNLTEKTLDFTASIVQAIRDEIDHNNWERDYGD